jgi:hypothetical protein
MRSDAILRSAAIVSVLLLASSSVPVVGARSDDPHLTWSAKQAEAIGTHGYRRGRVGGIFDMRMLKTERSYNYKLAATWLTPDVIRATARLLQLRSRLSEDETRALVAEAEAISGTAVMVEIDPREGSGVIPNEWEAFLQPKDRPAQAVRGVVTPRLRDVKSLAACSGATTTTTDSGSCSRCREKAGGSSLRPIGWRSWSSGSTTRKAEWSGPCRNRWSWSTLSVDDGPVHLARLRRIPGRLGSLVRITATRQRASTVLSGSDTRTGYRRATR